MKNLLIACALASLLLASLTLAGCGAASKPVEPKQSHPDTQKGATTPSRPIEEG